MALIFVEIIYLAIDIVRATINAVSKLMFTCLNGKNPRQGICCDFGLIYDRGMCVNEWLVEVNFDTNTTPICKLKHPFLEICLKCPQGYSVSYEIPYACV